MRKSRINTGVGFGIASGVITTLGLMIGTFVSTSSKSFVLGSVFTIAVADAFSDAFGIHVSEETKKNNSLKEIWLSTFYTFFTKFFVALSFSLPIFFLSLPLAILINIIWSFFLIGIFSYYLAKKRGDNITYSILEHFLIMVVVIITTFYVGKGIEYYFFK